MRDNKRKIQSVILSFIENGNSKDEETGRKYNEIGTFLKSPKIHKDKEDEIIWVIEGWSTFVHLYSLACGAVGLLYKVDA